QEPPNLWLNGLTADRHMISPREIIAKRKRRLAITKPPIQALFPLQRNNYARSGAAGADARAESGLAAPPGTELQVSVRLVAQACDRLRNLVEDCRIIDGGRRLPFAALDDPPHHAAQDLARARLRQPVDDAGVAEGGNRPDPLAHERDAFPDHLVVVAC